MSLGIKPIVDFAFKKIFGSPENSQALIGLLNAILELPQPITEVEILNPFNYQEFAEDKLIVLDVRARDAVGRNLNIEMQVSVYEGLLQRLTYYACSLYVDQLVAGENYGTLRPAISICLLNKVLFRDTTQPHHGFRMLDSASGRLLENSVEVHTVELTKYNLDETTTATASPIEQWAFFLLRAHEYDPDRLRKLLPAVEFDQAISVVETIASKTEDRAMYDQREKAQRDYEWALAGAQEEGRKEGLEKGLEKGVLAGQIQALQQVLGNEQSSLEDLQKYSPDQLSAMLSALQERVRTRGS